ALARRARERAGAPEGAPGQAAPAEEARARRRGAESRAKAAEREAERWEAELAQAAEAELAAARRLAEVEARRASAEEAARRAEAQAEERRREEGELDASLAALRAALAPLDAEVARLEAEAREREAEAEAQAESLRRAREARLRAQAALAELEAERASLEEALREAAEAVHEAELALARAEARRDAVLGRAKELYGVEAAELARTEPVTDPGAERRLLALRAELAKIGSVDAEAVARYEEERARHEELASLAGDLEDALRALDELAESVAQAMEARFRETLGEVRQAFRETFAELFGGGEADLVLDPPRAAAGPGADPAVPPDGAAEPPGLHILAQPPGRRTNRLSLLSGGERALTAIAFLFALLRVRPAPFGLLDEIDAALDEANVARFGELLRQQAERMQVLVITHQKGTMEVADRLFGVTMSEAGVSQVVSVSLEGARGEAREAGR
ncbi:MAG: AAA family ATPase, partial [Clostridia bacterium]|nr:AAA family ATPase [Clostridia bacterium]